MMEMPSFRPGLFAFLFAGVVTLPVVGADDVGGGALDLYAGGKKVATQSTAAAASKETYDYGVSNFDKGWEFALRDFRFTFCKSGLGPGGNNNGIPDVLASNDVWRAVTIPHDWMLGCPVSQGGRNGFRAVGPAHPQNSIGWYRKTFRLPGRFESGKVYLQFDGIYRDAMVWVNGVYLGRNDSGYIGRRFDVTDVLYYDSKPDSVVVRVDATRTSGWWYDGAGIYRHVKLILKRADHLEPDSVFFRTVSVGDGKATVAASARKVGRGRIEFVLDGKTFTDQLTLDSPKLWSPDAPNLHRFSARLVADDGAVLDEESFDVGIRTIRFDAAHGLFVNDRPVKVHGVCCHQDFGCVGVAVPDAIQDYRVRRLKAMGVNADRTCHNPPTPEFLDACDRHGILVMDEQRFFSASDEGLDQLRRLVLRDRNHPSVIAWSLGNEEHNVQGDALGHRIAKRMYRVAKELDPTRAITYGGNNGACWTGVNEVVDVRGVNYVRIGSKNISGPNAFECPDGYHAAHPAQPVWGSEESSAFATRGSRAAAPGVWPDGDTRAENVAFPWVATAEECWNWAAAREWFAGPFIWTGFDYRGESRWPALINNFGAMDLCGFAKAKYWYYRANWTDEDVLHVSPHWNAPTTNLVVDTNCDEVELFVNGTSVGRRKGDRLHHLNFPVTWTPGEVVAKGRRGGRDLEFRMATSGPATKLSAVADRTTLVADGADATVVNFMALDAAGREVPDADGLVVFEVEGAGEIIGVGNGNPVSHEDEVMTAPWRRKLFNGLCQIAVRSAGHPGTLTIRARLGDAATTTTIEVKSAR